MYGVSGEWRMMYGCNDEMMHFYLNCYLPTQEYASRNKVARFYVCRRVLLLLLCFPFIVDLFFSVLFSVYNLDFFFSQSIYDF